MIKKGFAGLVILGILFVALNRLLGLSERRIEVGASSITYPLLRLQNVLVGAFAGPSAEHKRSVGCILEDFEKLTKERDALLHELISLKALQRYAEDTNDLRDYMKRYSVDSLVIAPILLRNFAGEHFFLIDAGESCGIKKDMIALYRNALVGKVTQVYPSYSKILLITDKHCNVSALCSSHGVKGIHHGLKKGLTTLDYVDHRDEVTVGDLVITSGEGGIFPRGFGLGRITHVDQGGGYGRSIVIEPFVDLKKIDYCCIVPHTITAHEGATDPISVASKGDLETKPSEL